jgi:hypothetical protein
VEARGEGNQRVWGEGVVGAESEFLNKIKGRCNKILKILLKNAIALG